MHLNRCKISFKNIIRYNISLDTPETPLTYVYKGIHKCIQIFIFFQ